MKIFWYSLLSLFILLLIIAGLTYLYLPSITSYILSKDFKADVAIENIELKKEKIIVKNFTIKQPVLKNAPYSFTTDKITVEMHFSNLLKKKLIINKIQMDNLKIYVEFYDKTGEKNNWVEFLKDNNFDNVNKKYLIKDLYLKNIQLILYRNDGRKTEFDPVESMHFTNISQETGFPIDEIEKAIINQVLKELFIKHGLQNLIKTLNPLNIIPKILPFGN